MSNITQVKTYDYDTSLVRWKGKTNTKQNSTKQYSILTTTRTIIVAATCNGDEGEGTTKRTCHVPTSPLTQPRSDVWLCVTFTGNTVAPNYANLR